MTHVSKSTYNSLYYIIQLRIADRYNGYLIIVLYRLSLSGRQVAGRHISDSGEAKKKRTGILLGRKNRHVKDTEI